MARKALVALACCTLIPTFGLWLTQDRFVYAPSAEAFPVDPAAVGITDVAYRTADGLELHGWLVPSRRPTPACGVTPVALLFHGQGGNKTWAYPTAAALAEHGTTVFLAEYRGYGDAPGDPSEDGLAADARAALEAVRRLPGVDPARIVLVGTSLGTGVATRLATEQTTAGLVLLSPYTSLPDVAWARFPVLPYGLLMHNRFDTLSRIGSVEAPTMVILGTDDDTVPVDQSRRVYAAARHPDGLIELGGLGHQAAEIHVGDAAIRPVSGAVSRWTGCPRP